MATPGVIPYSSIPSPVPSGLFEACESALTAAGFSAFVTRAPEGVLVSDVPTVNTVLAGYTGGAAEVAWHKTNASGSGLLDQLNVLMGANAVLFAMVPSAAVPNKLVPGGMIPAGAVTTLTGTQVANFLAQVTNNYRSLRASINAATTMAQLNAININAGWPANP